MTGRLTQFEEPPRGERTRKHFGFSRWQWYVIAPIEYRIRHLLWRLLRG